MSKNKLQKENIKKDQKAQSAPLKKESNTFPFYLSLLIVFCVPVLLYLQTIHFGYTNFDDDGIIFNNIKLLSSLKNIPQAFLCDAYVGKVSVLYRPLQTVSYIIDIFFSDPNATWMFHLTNVILFGISACLLFLLFLRFSIPRSLAIVLSLVYCVNPLFVSSVAWIPSRGDLLLAIFVLLTFLFFIDYTRTGKVKYLVLHWISFTTALYCKETAAFLPFMLLTYFVVFTKNKVIDTKNIVTLLLYTFSGILWAWIRSKSIGESTQMSDQFQVGMPAFINNLRSIPESFTAFFLPFNVAVMPGYSIFKTSMGLILIAGIFYLGIKNKERLLTEKLFCILWFLLLLIPTMFFHNTFIDYLNHRFYLPFIGILLLLLFIIPQKWIFEKTKLMTYVGVVLIITFSFITFKDISSYANPFKFYDAAIARNEQNPLAYNNRGSLKFQMEDYQAALSDFNFALTSKQKFVDAYLNIGITQKRLKNYSVALEYYDKYIQFRPQKANVYLFKGMTYVALNDFNAAISCFTLAIERNPNYWEAFGNRAIAKYQLKDYAGAIVDSKKVLQLIPNEPHALEIITKSELILKQ